jgi:rare lipoprotein A
MTYVVQRGDTIAKVTRLLGLSWKELKRLNPHAVGRSLRTGRWFLKEGAEIRSSGPFHGLLKEELLSRQKEASEARSPDKGRWIKYTIRKGDTLWSLAVHRFHVRVEDLIRDNGIADPRRIRPGQRIRVRLPAYPREQRVVASWYGRAHHGRLMANGQPFNMYGSTIAHRELPLGTRVELENPRTGVRVRAIVTDRGPYVDGRDVDLSYALARRLSLVEQGVGELIMRVLG